MTHKRHSLPEDCVEHLLQIKDSCDKEKEFAFGQAIVDHCNATQPEGFGGKVVANMDECWERLEALKAAQAEWEAADKKTRAEECPCDLVAIAGCCRQLSIGKGLQ